MQVDDLQGRLDTALEERGEFEQQVIALNESTARYKTELARIQADSTSKHRATADVLVQSRSCHSGLLTSLTNPAYEYARIMQVYVYLVQVERVKSELTKRITELEITLQRERAARGVTAATNDKVLEEARAKVLELTSQVRYCCPFTRSVLRPIRTGANGAFAQTFALTFFYGVLFE